MYAVIKTGGKQYRVSPGDKLKVETIDAEVGASFDFDTVLMISDGDELTVGAPTIASAKVTAEVVAHGRGKKVEIIKFRRRKHHQKRTGHRQNFTQIEIQSINGKGAVAKKKAAPAKKAKAADSDSDAKATKKAAAPKKAAPAKKAAAPKKETATKKPAAKKATPAKKDAPAKKATTAKKPAAKKAAPAKKDAPAKKATAAKKPAAKKTDDK